jgi:ammonium transporter, Amt family
MKTLRCLALVLLILVALSVPSAARADEKTPGSNSASPTASPNSGDTAWMLTSAALVLMMTAPGLALFYGGLVRKKNILGVMMQCMFLAGLLSVVWALWGYSLAFDKNLDKFGFVGGFNKVCMNHVMGEWNSSTKELKVPLVADGTIPELLFLAYQGMFFVITPALICGAFAERMKFSTMCVLMVLWGTFIYCPLAHWVWSTGGWLNDGQYRAFDFAGGTVVHISSGFSALVCALVLGKRLG